MVGMRFAIMLFPAPGGPTMSSPCSPAAAMTNGDLALIVSSCVFLDSL
jgi:hypothetical protein